jgi:hypothetical protein
MRQATTATATLIKMPTVHHLVKYSASSPTDSPAATSVAAGHQLTRPR